MKTLKKQTPPFQKEFEQSLKALNSKVLIRLLLMRIAEEEDKSERSRACLTILKLMEGLK